MSDHVMGRGPNEVERFADYEPPELRSICCTDPDFEATRDVDDQAVWEVACANCDTTVCFIHAPRFDGSQA